MRLALSCISAVSSKSSNRNHSLDPSNPVFSGFHCVGWAKSAHGIRGELFVRLYAGQADWLDAVTELHLLLPGQSQLQPFEIELARPHKEGLIVKLSGVGDRNRSEELQKSRVYIDEGALASESGERIYLREVLGFKVFDKEAGELGVVAGFGTNGAQDLLRVHTPEGREHLIPFIDPFIVHIDFDKQELKMDLPPGLLTIEEK